MKIHTDIQYNVLYKAKCCLVFSSTAEMRIGKKSCVFGVKKHQFMGVFAFCAAAPAPMMKFCRTGAGKCDERRARDELWVRKCFAKK
jgi:hypothetical protein